MLTPEQERAFFDHLRAAGARETCPLCDAGRATVRMVCGGEFIARVCAQCKHVLLFECPDELRTSAEDISRDITFEGDGHIIKTKQTVSMKQTAASIATLITDLREHGLIGT